MTSDDVHETTFPCCGGQVLAPKVTRKTTYACRCPKCNRPWKLVVYPGVLQGDDASIDAPIVITTP